MGMGMGMGSNNSYAALLCHTMPSFKRAGKGHTISAGLWGVIKGTSSWCPVGASTPSLL